MFPSCQFQSPSNPTASLIAALVALTLLFLFYWLWRRSQNLDLSFALFVLLSMFANPFYFEHYNVILVLPMAIALASLRGLPRWQMLLGGALLLGAMLCLTVPTNSARVLLAWSQKRPELHFKAHLVEIQTALATPLLMILLGWRSFSSASRPPGSTPG